MTTDTSTLADTMEQHLLSWGSWLQGGKRGHGYPVTNVLHQSWLPPTPGMTPTMCTTAGSDRIERAIHRAVQGMSIRMQNTLVAVYVMRAPAADWPDILECADGTVRQRIAIAKRLLVRALD